MKSRRHAMAYQNAERQAFAESDDPHALIAILFDELLRQMRISLEKRKLAQA